MSDKVTYWAVCWTGKKRLWYLWGSLSIDTHLTFSICRLGGSSIPYAARRRIGLSTRRKHSRAGLRVTDLSGWFPQKASHSLRYSFPRDKARLPRLSSFLHSWLQVRRWPARLCCPGGSNWLSLICWQRWRQCHRSQPYSHLCFLRSMIKTKKRIQINLDWWCFRKNTLRFWCATQCLSSSQYQSMEPSQLGRQHSRCLRTREPCKLGSGIFWHTSKRGRSGTIRPILATHRQYLHNVSSCHWPQLKRIPGHSDALHSPASVDSPEHWSSPPKSAPLQALARSLDPLPQDTLHWDHWPQSCHSAAIAAVILKLRNFQKKQTVGILWAAWMAIPGHSDVLQCSASVEWPGHCSSPPTAGWSHPRALILDPIPQEAVHWDHWPHSCHSATVAAILPH